jgi:O-antigen/teichoic acid export membrane protein
VTAADEGTGRPGPTPPRRRPTFSEGVAFSVLSFGSIAVLSLVTAVVTARIYGIQVMGEFALAFAPTGIVWVLSSVREQPALVRALAPLAPRDPRATGLFAAVFGFSFVLTLTVSALAAGVVVLVFDGPLDQPGLVGPALASLAGYALITNPCWNIDTVFAAYRAGRQLFWVRLHQAVAYLVLAILASIELGTVWGPILATILSWATALVHRLVILPQWIRIRVPRADLEDGRRALPELIRFGLKITPATLADGIANESGTWILAATGSIVTLGAYNRAWTLSRRFVELNWRLAEMLLPTLVERRSTGDREGFDRALVDTLRYVAIGMLLPAAAGGGAATQVMELFGPGFDEGAGALAILLLMPALATLSSSQNMALLSLDRPLTMTWITLARMVTILVASTALTLSMGPTGTALGVICGYAVDLALQLLVTRRHLATPLHVLWPAREVAGLVVAYTVGFAASRGAGSLVGGAAGLLLALPAGAVAYAVAYVVVGGWGTRDARRFDALVGARLRRRRVRLTAP